MNDRTLAALEAALQRRNSLLAELEERPSGLDWCERHTEIADELMRYLWDDLAALGEGAPELSLVATGGYGRREVSPASDVDLTLIPLDESDPRLDAAVRTLFRNIQYAFDNQLGIKVGYAFRLISDVPGLDAKTRTGLMDARFVAGSRRPLEALTKIYWNTFPVAEFLIAKIEEREAAMARFGDTPYVVEPELKEGAGGLRCFQCANWLGAAIGERMSRPGAAYDYILLVRNQLHRTAKRHMDSLTRGRRQEIADRLGLDSRELGSTVAEAMAQLHDEYMREVEKLGEARYPLCEGVMALRGEARISADAQVSSAALGVALATRLGLRVAELPAKVSGGINGSEALVAITQGEATLRNLDRCRVLDSLLPELAACRTLMPADASHSYTVFEHTLRMIRLLDGVEPASFYGELKASLRDMSALYLAALLHDVGKAVEDGAPHSESGERIAREVGARWRLPKGLLEQVAWLVREHLTLARFIRMRDVFHPETALELAQVVGDAERLTLLSLLTWADVNAVSSEAWTPVQDTFLRELYARTLAVFEAEEPSADAGVSRRRILRRLRREEEVPPELLEQFIDAMPAHYVLSVEPERARDHFHMAVKAAEGEPTIDVSHQPELGASLVTVCIKDAPGLLSRILGVFYALDLSIVGIHASTSKGEPEIALDWFTVTFGNRPAPLATTRRLVADLTSVLEGTLAVEDLLRKHGKDPDRRQEILTWNYIEGAPGILEVRAPRGRGMAFRVSRMISDQGWNILAARVGQWAGQGAAAFYIETHDEGLVPREAVQAALSSPVV